MPTASYLLIPWFATADNAADIAQNNSVRLVKIFLPADITVTAMTWIAALADAGKFWGVGLYDTDGNLVLDSGPIVMATSGADELMSASVTPLLVTEGIYWMGFSTNSATSQMRMIRAAPAVGTPYAIDLIWRDTSMIGDAANSSSAGQLPATTGVISTPALPAELAPLVKLQA